MASQTDSQTQRQTFDAELIDVASRLRLAVTRTARRLRQEAGGELTPTAMAALASVERNAPVTPSELAEIEDVQRPTATRVINTLTEAGLVSREDDPDDGRSCRLSPTDAGTAYLAERRTRKSAYMAEMLSTLDPSDVETLSRAASILESTLRARSRHKDKRDVGDDEVVN